jgi:hypothetical protein
MGDFPGIQKGNFRSIKKYQICSTAEAVPKGRLLLFTTNQKREYNILVRKNTIKNQAIQLLIHHCRWL